MGSFKYDKETACLYIYIEIKIALVALDLIKTGDYTGLQSVTFVSHTADYQITLCYQITLLSSRLTE